MDVRVGVKDLTPSCCLVPLRTASEAGWVYGGLWGAGGDREMQTGPMHNTFFSLKSHLTSAEAD